MGITKTQKALAGFSALKKQENGREVIEQILNMGQPRFAGALDFNGEDTAVEISDAISGPFNEGTISIWITKRSDGTELRTIYNPAGTSLDGLIIFSDSGSSQLRFQYGTGSAIETLNFTFSSKRWVHVTAVWGSFGGRLYIDGELKRTGDGVPDVDFSSTHNIGRQTTSRYHDGNICQLQLWNRALSGSEIRANMYRRLKGDEEGLVGYYPLDSLDVTDLTENGNDGSLEGDVSLVQPFNPLFTGDDRPELHQEKIAVEGERENLLLHSNDLNLGSISHSDYLGFEVHGVAISGIAGDQIITVNEVIGRNGVSTGSGALIPSSSTGIYTVSFLVERRNYDYVSVSFKRAQDTAASMPIVRFNLTENSSLISYEGDGGVINHNIKNISNNIYLLTVTIDKSVNDILRLGLILPTLEEDRGGAPVGSEVGFKHAQAEKGRYSSLHIPTEGSPVSRPEPKVLFPDTLPEQGHIHIKCDTINADQILFANESNALAIDDNYLSGKLLGNPFGSLPIGTDADLYDRIQFQVILTWDEEGGNVFFKVDGQVTQFPLSIQQIEDLDPNIFLGANADGEGQESCYFDILRTGEQRLTLQEAKNLMEL